jgi:3'-phosphoadenosine 5'-phosphosulfate sulfotransferase (PAPS reductase)/FAD synthetase
MDGAFAALAAVKPLRRENLAPHAFYPAKISFPVLHIDTTWKFRDMITFRDVTAAHWAWI